MEKVEALKHYKFSLAFENTNEEDYVTEKFFQSLVAGIDRSTSLSLSLLILQVFLFASLEELALENLCLYVCILVYPVCKTNLISY